MRNTQRNDFDQCDLLTEWSCFNGWIINITRNTPRKKKSSNRKVTVTCHIKFKKWENSFKFGGVKMAVATLVPLFVSGCESHLRIFKKSCCFHSFLFHSFTYFQLLPRPAAEGDCTLAAKSLNYSKSPCFTVFPISSIKLFFVSFF